MAKDEVKDKEAEKKAKKEQKKEAEKEAKKEQKKEAKKEQKKEEKKKAKKEQKEDEKKEKKKKAKKENSGSDSDSNSHSGSDSHSHIHSGSDTEDENNNFDPLINIPVYPFKYIAKNKAGDILNEYFTTFKVQILKGKIVNYIVNLYFLQNDNLLEKFEFQIQRTKSNIKKNAKRLFELIRSGYPGKDGNDYNRAVTAIIKRRNDPPIFTSSSTYSTAATDQTVESVTVLVASPPEPGGTIIIGDATYTIITLGTLILPTPGTVYLSNYSSTSTSFTVPLTVKDQQSFFYKVVSIGNPDLSTTPSPNGFTESNSLQTITFTSPSNVTTFGNFSFSGCGSLQSINIPSSVTNFGSNIFSNCTNLATVTINSNITSFSSVFPLGKTSIQTVTFNNCSVPASACLAYTALKSVTVSGTSGGTSISSSTIGTSAFYNCTNLTALFLSSTALTTIEGSAFFNCTNTAFSSVTIPASVTTIGTNAFYNCTSLVTVILNSNIQNFRGAFSVTTTDKIQNITFNNCNVYDSTFSQSTALTSVTVSGSTSSTIGTSAFYNCISLKTLSLSSTALTSIGNFAFSNCGSAVSATPQFSTVTIPASVTTIGTRAFLGCSKLTTLVFSVDSISVAALTSIGTSAFYNITKLNGITIPNTTNPLTIGDSAFLNCTGVQVVTLGNNVVSIGTSAFYGCTGLTTLSLSSTALTSIGDSAFYNCGNAVTTTPQFSTVTIPASVTSLGQNAFTGCSYLTTVAINSNITYSTSFSTVFSLNIIQTVTFNNCNVPTSALSGSTVLKSVTVSGATSSTIGSSAFNNCTALTTLSLSSTALTSIGDSAFYGCSNTAFTIVTIPASVISIGVSAFVGCSKLTTLAFPSSGSNLTSIGASAFQGLTALGNNTGGIIIPTTINPLTIGDSAFSGCTGATAVTLGNNVSAIGVSTFNNFGTTASGSKNFFTTVTIPASVISIGASAFLNCSKLTTLAFSTGSNLTSIGISAFQGLTTLNGINIPNTTNALTIGDSAFSGCTGAKTVTLGNNVVSIGSVATASYTPVGSVFLNCGNAVAFAPQFTTVTIPASVTSIGPSSFIGCSKLTTLAFSTSSLSALTSIGGSAFQNLTTLNGINIPNTTSALTIGNSAFNGCTGAQFVTLGNKVSTIGVSTFYGCTNSNFISVTIPASVISIGASAFYNCSKLTGATYQSNSTINWTNTFNSAVLTTLIIDIIGTITGTATATTPPTYPLITGGNGVITNINLSSNVTTINSDCAVTNGFTATAINLKFESSVYNEVAGSCNINNNFPSSNITTAIYNTKSIGLNSTPLLTGFPTTLKALTIASGSESINQSAFSSCAFTTVTFLNTATTIGVSAFYNSSLVNVTLPTSINTVGINAFQNCASLIYAQLPTNFTTIPNSMFSGCAALTYIGTAAATANTNWFYSGSSTPSTTPPISSVGSSAFYNCTKLSILNVNTSLTSVGLSAFQGCSNINFVSIPGSVPATITSTIGIASSAFYGCSALTSVNIPNLLGTVSSSSFVPSIQPSVFYGCGFKIISFKNITAPTQGDGSISLFTQGITSIGANAFAQNTSLGYANLISNNISYVQTVGSSAFYNCTGLNTVGLYSTYTNTSGTGMVSITSNAFYFCSQMQFNNIGLVYTDSSTGVVPNYFNGPGTPANFNNFIFTTSPPTIMFDTELETLNNQILELNIASNK